MEKVFALPEVLEKILLEVDMVTLLVSAQRVSKAWKDLIKSSIAIQQKLFFKAATSGPVEKNPLLKKYLTPFYESEVREKAPDWTHAKVIAEAPFAKNAEAFRRSGASWREMLLQQPPQFRYGFARDIIDGVTCKGSIMQIASCEEGVTAGGLWDDICKWFGKPVTNHRHFQLWWETRDLYENAPAGLQLEPASGVVDLLLYIQWNQSTAVSSLVPAEQLPGTPLRWIKKPRYSIHEREEFVRIWTFWFRSEDCQTNALGDDPDEEN